uniref:Uncharacterized protein n=1 Tax=Brassica oleracea TaxID=3712 RepID=A0A3P6GEV8_BRAOL|nr:unnamed protein product [Brassica oleracea]
MSSRTLSSFLHVQECYSCYLKPTKIQRSQLQPTSGS